MSKLVFLTALYDLPEAYCMRAMLNAYGIPVFLFGEYHSRMAINYLFALQGIGLHVLEDDVEEARHLLQATFEMTGKSAEVAAIEATPLWERIVVFCISVVVLAPLPLRQRATRPGMVSAGLLLLSVFAGYWAISWTL